MTRRPYAAIILAGGLSSRMRRFKPLLPLGNRTITDHLIDIFRQNDVDVILVGGHRREELFAGILSRDIVLRENPDYESGMLSSVQAGVKDIDEGYQGFFVLPVDIPLVRTATIRILLEAARENPRSIIYPVFKGRRGHPPVIPGEMSRILAGFTGEGGLKAILARYNAASVNTPVADSGILFDIDTPSDYDDVLRRFASYHTPRDEECDAIFEIAGTSEERIVHGRMVAKVAAAISQALIDAGQTVDVGLIEAAARLHDVAKGKQRHDETGGELLRHMGFDLVADIVGIHTDLGGEKIEAVSLPAKIVFLADKYVRLDRIVSLEERYRISRVQYAKDPNIEEHVLRRKTRALTVKQDLEVLTGTPLDDIVLRIS